MLILRKKIKDYLGLNNPRAAAKKDPDLLSVIEQFEERYQKE